MKTCPVCGDTYSERIDFCFNEGAVLRLMPSAMDAPMPRASASGAVSPLATPPAPRRTSPPVDPDEAPAAPRRGGSAPPAGPPAPSAPPSGATAAPAATSPSDEPAGEGSSDAVDASAVKTAPPPRKAPAPDAGLDDPFFSSAAGMADAGPVDDDEGSRTAVSWIVVVGAVCIALLLGVFVGIDQLGGERPEPVGGDPRPDGTAVAIEAPAPAPVPEPAGDREAPAASGDDDLVADEAIEIPPSTPADLGGEPASAPEPEPKPEPVADPPPPVRPAAPVPAAGSRPRAPRPQPAPSPIPTPPPAASTSTAAPPAEAGGSPWDMPAAPAPKGTAVFTSDPPGAVVRLDGRARGRTPLEVELDHGTYDLELTLDGYRTFTRSVTIASDAPKFPTRLQPLVQTGNVLVVAEGWEGAELFVDGQARGRIPTRVKLEEGMHTFVVKRGGQARTSQRRVRLAEAGVTRIDLAD